MSDNSVLFYDQIKTPIGKITIGKSGTLEPMEDITALEATHISILLAAATMSKWGGFDFESYIKDHKLERHFKPGEAV